MYRKLYIGSGLLIAPVTAGRVNQQKNLSPVHVPTSKNVRHLQVFFSLNCHNSFVFACEGKTEEMLISSEGSTSQTRTKHPMKFYYKNKYNNSVSVDKK